MIAAEQAKLGIAQETTVALDRGAHRAVNVGQEFVEGEFAQVMQQPHDKRIITRADANQARNRTGRAGGAERVQPERPRTFHVVG